MAVGPDGSVTARTDFGTVTFGYVGLTRFVNPAGLLRNGEAQFVRTATSRLAVDGTPGALGLSDLDQGSHVNANVDLPTELLNILIFKRASVLNAQAYGVEDDLLAATAAPRSGRAG